MKIYEVLNKLFEQPFFKKLIEIVKFFKLQKNYWSVASLLIIFIIGQVTALISSDQIEQITQNKLNDQTIDIWNKIFWNLVELILTNGSWWALLLGISILILVTLVKIYETKHTSGVIDSILYNKFFESFDVFEYEIKQASDNVEYIHDTNRNAGIIQIREEIDKTLSVGSSSFVRIEGFSGIGKTRFIYETLNDNKYKKHILYVQSYEESIFADLKILLRKLPTDREILIFIIDECPYEAHVRICRGLNQYSNLIVITIDQVLSQQDKTNCKDEKRITLEGLGEIERVKLIQEINSRLPEDTAKKIAFFTEGYPRLAKFMAESYDIEKGDTNDPNEKARLLDRIVEKVTANNVESIKLLQVIALFKMFPNKAELQPYKKIIFEHLGINHASASLAIKDFIKKGIIREGGRFLYISPRPVSIHLFNQFIEINDYEFINELFQKLNNEGLMNSFFEKLQGIPFDARQHKDLLFQVLSKITYEEIKDGFGSKIFYSLCLKDRVLSIEILNNLLRDKTKDDLLQLNDGRRYLVHSLEELIAFQNTYLESVKILFKLARAENESWGNNSKGIFIESFQWILGGTEVNIVKRLEVLKSLYQEYISDEDRIILLNALKRAYPQHNYMATHKNHSTFPEDIPEHYRPTSQEEIDLYFKKLKELIEVFYNLSSEVIQSKIINDLIDSFRMLIRYSQINNWILDFIEQSINKHTQLKTHFFEILSIFLEFDKDDKLSDDITNRVSSLYDKYTKAESIDEIRELFLNTEKYRYYSEEVFENHCQTIAQDIVQNKNFDVLLNKNTANLFELGREVAKIDDESKLYEDILNLIPLLTQNSSNRFVLAYIFNSKMGTEDNYEKLFKEIYAKLNDKSLMFDFIHYSKPTEISMNYICRLLENKEIKSEVLENLTFGFWLRELQKSEFIIFIDKINTIIEDKCDSFDLCMQYIHTNKDTELIKKYTEYYIEHNLFGCIGKRRMITYLNEIVDEYFSSNFELNEALLAKVWDFILIELKGKGKFDERTFQPVYKIIKSNSNYFWKNIRDLLEELKPQKYPLYGSFTHFMQGGYLSDTYEQSIFSFIDSNHVIDWLKSTSFKEAKYIIADTLNIDFETDSLPEIVIQLLTEFSDDRDLYASIKSRSEGWTGSYVPVANKKISNIDRMLEYYQNNKNVIEFLKWAKKSFEYHRDREQIRDEERLY
ncbi:MAG: hypothetical protein M0P91_10680 [Sulfuricurvum sp.]|uniref:hypothetical protein n=1 Tax=Sulfuricurvum sp. TaxID=2025608 RepID=UPI0025F0B46A|nr:hypothetical protein [Sulfuricurvum sp.]MCK9373655.1 hypothetical protein [Sulfuricurvum sp.]